jgi:hypothetical protein
MFKKLTQLFTGEKPEPEIGTWPKENEQAVPPSESEEAPDKLQQSFDTAEILAESTLGYLRKKPATIENNKNIKTQEGYLAVLRNGTTAEKISAATVVLGERYKTLLNNRDAFGMGNERVKVAILSGSWKRDSVNNLIQSNAVIKETEVDLANIAEALAALQRRT